MVTVNDGVGRDVPFVFHSGYFGKAVKYLEM